MRNIAIILISVCLCTQGCKTTISSKCGPCPLIATIAPYISIKMVDKTSGADLFLSPGSPYKLSDLKVTSTYTAQEINLIVDSMDKVNRFIRLLAYPSQTYTLKLADLPANTIDIIVKQDSPKCCPILKVASIKVDNVSVCSTCTLNQLVTIKK